MTAVCFDVMGTLFDLAAVRRRLEGLGAPPLALEAWFERVLHTAAALTLVDDFRPFPELAEPALRSVLAQLDLDHGRAGEVIGALGELDAYPEADAAVARLADAGVRVVALTNGSEQNTRKLLARAGLEGRFEAVVTTASVRRYKPHRAVYDRAVAQLGLAPEAVTLVAAHAWDVMGARAAGLDAVWVDRLERCWPLPVAEAARAADLDEAARLILARL